MGVNPAPEACFNPEVLSDAEIIQLLPPKLHKRQERPESDLTPLQRQGLDVLWPRHCGTVERHLRGKIFGCHSSLCPLEEPDKEHFLGMCLDSAYTAFLRRIWRQDYRNFDGFLCTLAYKVALDVRKEIKKRGITRAPAKGGSGNKPTPPVEVIQLDETTLLVDGGEKTLRSVAARELRDIFDKYAGESQQNMLSMKVAIDRKLGSTWREIAEEFLPAEVDDRPLLARMAAVRRFENHDKRTLLVWLQKHGISDARAFEV